tara:strand:+ start:1245 stop:1751 length:507 start_codon:yes stop_codon:yes gene_type:complete
MLIKTYNENKLLNSFYFLKKRGKIPLFFSIFIIDLVFHLAVSCIITIYNPEILDVFDENMSLTEIFIFTVIIGPIIETFLFQYLIIEVLFFFKRIKINTIIIISSLSFSLTHYYNFIYILVTFLSGIIYASYYLYLKEEKQRFPFLYICLFHSLYNFSAFILDDILGL